MTFERKFELFQQWCTSVLIANCVNKHDIWFRDVYPYKAGEQPNYPPDKYKVGDSYITGSRNVISRPLIGQTAWKRYQPENINGRQVHYLQILRNSYQPWVTFEQYCERMK